MGVGLDAVPLDGTGCRLVVPVQNGDRAYLAQTFIEMVDMLAAAAQTQAVCVARENGG